MTNAVDSGWNSDFFDVDTIVKAVVIDCVNIITNVDGVDLCESLVVELINAPTIRTYFQNRK